MAQVSSDFNERLMEYVKMHPHIYDKRCKSFRNAAAKADSWEEIAKNMDTETSAVIKRYNTIRTKLSKYLNKIKLRSGSAALTMAMKPQFESLRWLVPHIDHRDVFINPQCSSCNQSPVVSISTLTGADENKSEIVAQEQDDLSALVKTPASQSAFGRPKKQAKMSSPIYSTFQDSGDTSYRLMEKEFKHPTDPNELFCLSLIPKMAGLTEDQRDYVHIEILQLIRRVRNSNSSNTPDYQQTPQSTATYSISDI